MNLDFFKPKETTGAYKVTVHKTGKLGFSKSASHLLNLKDNKYCKIGRNLEENESHTLYMVVCESKDDYTYNISKAGNYYYIKANQLLTDLNIDYKNEEITVIFDIEKKVIEDSEVFKLIKRIIDKRKKPSS